MWTLQSERTTERRTAIIGLELERYNIDIAALSETRFAGTGQLTEPTSGYTYLWSGLPESEKRLYGVGFAIKTSIIKKLENLPTAVNERLMWLRLKISEKRYATIISAYAPTMTNEEFVKEKLYADLDNILRQTPKEDKLIFLGDFNARVGANSTYWSRTIGKYVVGKCNSNGLLSTQMVYYQWLLLSKCKEHELVITNTMFQLPLGKRSTWMHPRSKHWHLIDYAIVRQRDLKDVCITQAVCGAECQTDHRMIRMKLKMIIQPQRRKVAFKGVIKLNVDRLKSNVIKNDFSVKMETAFNQLADRPSDSVHDKWKELKNQILKVSKETLGTKSKKQPDWFEENIGSITPLIDAKNAAHQALVTRNTCSTSSRLKECQHRLQREIRRLKNDWLVRKAREIQEFAEKHDVKKFYDAVKGVYGPSTRGTSPLLSADGTKLISDRNEILNRWVEHFNELLNRASTVQQNSIDNIKQQPVQEHLADRPTKAEIRKAIKLLQSGKAPGEDGIPAEIYKHGGEAIIFHIFSLFGYIWRDEDIPQELKDAIIVKLYKKKGSKSDCDNYRGIALLSHCSKILAKILQMRLVENILDENVSESQCGFRSNRGTADMIFAVRQLQEKSIEQNMPLYAVFIDLTKAFGTVSREALWKILLKLGCPTKFVNVLKQLHEGMQARVCSEGQFSDSFPINNGVKQGCVVAPILFILFFGAMLKDCLDGNDKGIFA